MFGKILIANRGEIACRIMRTAKRLGVATVAVYSHADVKAMHVAMADEAINIGPAPARESYLLIEKIIKAAHDSGAEAIHPGYGFLSENADFAEACENSNIVFIGPPSASIRAMGSKSAAKALMEKAGVPLLPGYHGGEQTLKRFQAEAARVGFPVALKAIAGGGGKGIRIIRSSEDMADGLETARREALSSFGNGILLLEKYLERPRHIEVQIFADSHGNIVHLFDRDCSVQRRHQKVLEEAPAPDIPDQTRALMADAAIKAARSVGYVGAGTIEFLYQDGAFYFMEMNTRLQVEHPVTEAITGFDLVEWQLRVASGESLPAAQKDIVCAGHAMEVRLCAEDPAHDFMPAAGPIDYLEWPPGVDMEALRIDTGFRTGDRISIYYDSLLAKVIVHASARRQAIRKLRSALEKTSCIGFTTNQVFLHSLLSEPDFADSAKISTSFIQEHAETLLKRLDADMGFWVAAALHFRKEAEDDKASARSAAWRGDPWGKLSGFRLNSPDEYRVYLQHSGISDYVSLLGNGETLAAEWGGQRQSWRSASLSDHQIILENEGQSRKFRCRRYGKTLALFEGPHSYGFHLADALERAAEQSGAAANDVRAPMPGTITALHVSQGQSVKQGERLVSLEAMKMVHNLTAPKDGIIAELRAKVGQQVEEQQPLVVMG